MSGMPNLPKFSFSLPVYNAERYLMRCLESIKNQDYPEGKIEVLLVDGGSTDNTREIAQKYRFVKLFDNPRRLADFGAKISMANATGDLFVIFASDNELVSADWLKTAAEVFNRDEDLACLWGKMIASADDAPLNRYYELIQNDPLSFFVNKNLQVYMSKASIEKIDQRDFYFFTVNAKMPLIWGANGLVYRTDYVRDIILRDEFVADNDVFQIMVERGKNKIAYCPQLNIYHHHLDSLSSWIKKWRRNYISHYLKQRMTRNLRWVFDEEFLWRLWIWIFYSGIPIFSFVHSLFLAIRNKNKYWLYHPLASFAQLATYILATISTREGWLLIRGRISKMLGKGVRIFKPPR